MFPCPGSVLQREMPLLPPTDSHQGEAGFSGEAVWSDDVQSLCVPGRQGRKRRRRRRKGHVQRTVPLELGKLISECKLSAVGCVSTPRTCTVQFHAPQTTEYIAARGNIRTQKVQE